MAHKWSEIKHKSKPEMQSKTAREVVSKTTFTTDSKDRDGGKIILDHVFAVIREFRSTGKLTVDFSQGSVCAPPTFEERQKVNVE